jgi:hypothetical protein
MPNFDKRRKAHPEEIDTSNGALFLKIVYLERRVKYLEDQIDGLIGDGRSRNSLGVVP